MTKRTTTRRARNLGAGDSAGARANRHQLQLCRQAHEALIDAFASSSDDVIRDLEVVGVQPGPDGATLLVALSPRWSADLARLGLVHDRLGTAAGRLRYEVAAAITRRKAPKLAFVVFPRGDG